MKSAYKKYKKYFTTVALIWAGCFVLFFFVYMLVLMPQKKSKRQIENKFAEKKKIYDSALRASQDRTKKRLNKQIQNLENRLKDFVIDFEDSANLTFDISQIAKEKGVTSFSIRSVDDRMDSDIPDCNHICENHIDIDFVAGFNQFAAFLNALERHRPVVFVDKFAITRSDQKNSEHQIDMSLVVFVKKPQGS